MPHESRASGPSDRNRFEHMRRGATAAQTFVRGRKRQDLETDDQLRRALVNAVQEIGEAAARVTDEGRKMAPGVPWGQIVAMRHVLVHVYWGVDNDQLWRTATIDVPELLQEIRSALESWAGQ